MVSLVLEMDECLKLDRQSKLRGRLVFLMEQPTQPYYLHRSDRLMKELAHRQHDICA
jgi:hypothetical protein